MITVTKTYLPDPEKFNFRLQEIWQCGIITNNGSQLKSLENRLKSFLEVPYLQITSNGTIAIQIAIKALGLKGKIITTPFSYVATTNSVLWENCIPVFVDIFPGDLNVDVSLIEKSIDKDVSGMLFTHVYGIPCQVEKIQQLANQYNLPVIYDAAHAFGVKVNGKPVLDFGTISTLSFHATKIFHTAEGGAVVAVNEVLDRKVFLMKSFGHIGDKHYSVGINGKNSEIHAVMGHCVLDDIKEIMHRRKSQWLFYNELLSTTSKIQLPDILTSVEYNYSYFPVVFQSEEKLLHCINELNNQQIFPRRYFNPSLNALSFVNGESCPVSESVSKRVACLPLYFDLAENEQQKIVEIIIRSL